MKRMIGRSKLDDIWSGPYELLEKVNEVTWKIGGCTKITRLVHENLLKLAPPSAENLQLEELRGCGRPKTKIE